MLRAVGLAAALLMAPAAMAQQAEPIAEAPKPAIMSDLASSTLLLDLVTAGDRLVAVGSRGHILYSDDQGKSWDQADVPVRQLLTAVYFADAKHGWAVGHDAVILHSSDGGETWQMQYRDPTLDEPADPEGPGLLERPLMDVWFRDLQTGFAVGAYGIFLRTDDGGATWQDRSDSIDNEYGMHYNAIAPVHNAGLFMVGEMGSMYRSSDYGDTWETLETSPYDGTWFGVSGTGQTGEVVVWGLRGNLYRSDNFGHSWQVAEFTNQAPEATLLGGTLSADGHLVVVGSGGVVLTSDDRGDSFETHTRADRIALATAKRLPDGELLMVGQHGVVKGSVEAPIDSQQ
ncbi:MAG: YCF48-related protein [Halopseudomonas sp.]|uniref:WD40/YVTN/BNR-like repeat-containing protein n=1 Tax=Halopseudomonas sp. TaxID=2901191 RepID=UPI00300151D0